MYRAISGDLGSVFPVILSSYVYQLKLIASLSMLLLYTYVLTPFPFFWREGAFQFLFIVGGGGEAQWF